jgi:hypothetical protein
MEVNLEVKVVQLMRSHILKFTWNGMEWIELELELELELDRKRSERYLESVDSVIRSRGDEEVVWLT